MNILNLLILIPLVTSLAVIGAQNNRHIKRIALGGSMVQLLAAVWITLLYRSMRAAGETAQMLFRSTTEWFSPLHINYAIGVDGISLVMILLTAMVVVAGVLVS